MMTYFLIFSRMSAILPKRFCVKKQLWLRGMPGCRSTATPGGSLVRFAGRPWGTRVGATSPVALPRHSRPWTG